MFACLKCIFRPVIYCNQLLPSIPIVRNWKVFPWNVTWDKVGKLRQQTTILYYISPCLSEPLTICSEIWHGVSCYHERNWNFRRQCNDCNLTSDIPNEFLTTNTNFMGSIKTNWWKVTGKGAKRRAIKHDKMFLIRRNNAVTPVSNRQTTIILYCNSLKRI